MFWLLLGRDFIVHILDGSFCFDTSWIWPRWSKNIFANSNWRFTQHLNTQRRPQHLAKNFLLHSSLISRFLGNHLHNTPFHSRSSAQEWNFSDDMRWSVPDYNILGVIIGLQLTIAERNVFFFLSLSLSIWVVCFCCVSPIVSRMPEWTAILLCSLHNNHHPLIPALISLEPSLLLIGLFRDDVKLYLEATRSGFSRLLSKNQ